MTYESLELKPKFDEVKEIVLENGKAIHVKQFLPLSKKLEVLSNILNKSTDDRGFYNTARLQFNINMELIYAYTDIEFPEETNLMEIYDTLQASGLFIRIYKAIPETDWFNYHAEASVASIMKYRNSVYGILDAISTDYDNLNLDVSKLRDALVNNEGIETLREITTTLG